MMKRSSTTVRRDVPRAGARGLPAGTRAAGWYQIGWSWEFSAGADPLPFHYFGRDIVGYRTESGRVVVADAFCPHLGAHLGHGGCVKGEVVVCPFHGWEWNADGTNASVPYGPRASVRNRLEVFEVREVDNHVVVWWDPAGGPPTLDCKVRLVPGDADLLDPEPDSTIRFENVAMPPQLPVENLVDFAHFKYVHKADSVGVLDSYEEIGSRFRTTISLEFGGGRPSTWLTPNGPVTGLVINDVYSVGFFVSRFEVNEPGVADMILTTATTPIDDERSDMFVTVTARATDIAKIWVGQERVQSARDLRVWEHLKYLDAPPLVGDEVTAMRALREWTYQFYSSDPSEAEQ